MLVVAERLSGVFEGVARIDVIRWEDAFYSGTQSFQEQIDAAVHGMADVDIVLCILWSRIGLKLNPAVWQRADGSHYESGTVFEYETAVQLSQEHAGVPEVFLFRKSLPVTYRAEFAAEDAEQHQLLDRIWTRWTEKEGYNTGAFNQFSDLDDFEHQIEQFLRQWLERRGIIVSGPVWDRRLHGSPFRGLSAFDSAHATVFFGRDDAIARIIARLRSTSFLLIIGASGAGKSSLLRAGLVSHIVRPGVIPEIDLWRAALLTPAGDAPGGLAEALLADDALGHELRENGVADAAALSAIIMHDPAELAQLVKSALDTAAQQRAAQRRYDEPRPARLLLAIDQLEWLFAEARSDAAEVFAAAIKGMVSLGLVSVVATLRSDAYAGLHTIPSLVTMNEAGVTYDLLPPSAAELGDIVTRPVAACHPPLSFETSPDGRSLADALISDATGGDALPLLQVTLDRLYRAQEERGDGLLRFADYPGIDQAVTEAAGTAFAELNEAARGALPALIAALVEDIATDPATGRRVLTLQPVERQRFERGKPERGALLDAFITHRLLTAEQQDGLVLVRPAHEALLRAWPHASAILTESEADIRVRRTLEPLVTDWHQAEPERRDGYLLTSAALLAAASQLIAHQGDDVPDAMQAFIIRSREAAEQRRQTEELRRSQVLAATARMRVRASPLYLSVVFVLLAAAVALRYLDPVGLQTLRSLVFDTYQQISPAAYDPDLLVRVVDIDEASLTKDGQWPWPRTRLAELVNDLTSSGAAAIAIDLLFAEPDRTSPEQLVKLLPPSAAAGIAAAMAAQPTNDQRFAAALAAAPSVTSVSLVNDDTTPFDGKSGFAIAGDDPRPFIPAYRGATGSLTILRDAAKGVGAVNWVPDRDQIMRRVNLVFRVGDTLVPSLAAEALRVAQGASTIVLKASNASGQSGFGAQTGLNHIRIGDADIPTDDRGAVRLRFRHTNQAAFIPAWKVLAGNVPSNEIAGRIILIGTSVPGLLDTHPTPLDPAVPGVEMHEQMIENILSGRYLRRPDYVLALEEVLLILVGLPLALLLPRISAPSLSILGGCLAVALLVGGWAAYAYAGLLLDPFYSIVALFGILTVLTFYVYRYAERQRQRLQLVFADDAAPALD